MSVLSFDELNKIYVGNYNRRSIPYEQYFADMDLSKEEKEKRIDFAEKMQDIMFFVFNLLQVVEEFGELEEGQDFIINQVKRKYSDLAINYVALDEYIEEYIENFAEEIAEVSIFRKTEPYYKSEDRAMYIAENEANSLLNYAQYIVAIKDGFTKKTWQTEKDKWVRKTHYDVESVTIGIKEPFLVGDSLLLFPKDTSFEPETKEIVGCRCTVEYHK